MIRVWARGFFHKYHGSVELAFDGDFVYIECHETKPRVDSDELDTWRTDTFDVFVATDVIAITGEE